MIAAPYRDYREHLAQGGPWDLIIADVPWRHSQPRSHDKARYLVSYPMLEVSEYAEMMRQCYAALRPNSNLWCWTDHYNLFALNTAAEQAGFTYRGLAIVRRKAIWLGRFMRQNVYFLPAWSKGKAYYNPTVAASFGQDLGTYRITRSAKPQAVYDRIIAHSLRPGGQWIDPFPATHIEERRGPLGTILLAPSLWRGMVCDHPPCTPTSESIR